MSEFPRFDLAGQVALVTGAARGIGRSIALALAHAGANVGLGFRDAKSGGTLVQEIEAMGRVAVPLQMDVTRKDEIATAIDEAVGASAASTCWSTTRARAPAIPPSS